jgi:UDP-2-acetamido-3-amino-2,3-dideoxy-glucuronate N-acetyltransferase
MTRDNGIFIHPLAIVECDSIGEGTRIWAYAHVMRQCQIGRDCNLGEGVFVETSHPIGDHVVIKNGVAVWEKVCLEDRVFVGPSAVFTNDRLPRADPRFKSGIDAWHPTRVQTGATIGANATIVCGITLGRWSMVAAGAVVTRDVADHVLVMGNPARPAGFVCECGLRLPARLECRCGRRYRRSGQGLSAHTSEAKRRVPRKR